MIPREQQISQSAQDFIGDKLADLNYIPRVLDLRDGFPTQAERASELVKTQVAVGFIVDPGGRLMEMGSDLTQRTHTVEFWTFATTENTGENVAYTIRAILEDAYGGLIPLKDIGAEGQPVIDQLQIDDLRRPTVQRQMAVDPRPWDLYVWTTSVRLIDTYYPALVN